MDDLNFGKRDKRGNWAPDAPLKVAPFWTGDWSKVGRWIVGYLWPWNSLHILVTLAYWFWIIEPNLALYRSFSFAGFALLFTVNAAGIFVMYGAVELFYYTRRKQGTRFKYNGKFPSDTPSDVFWFKSQNRDNVLRTFLVSIPIWTAVEVVFLYCFSNGIHAFGWLGWEQSWLWLAILTLLAPAIHEVHFYVIHWTIHQPPLYKWVHSVHHNSVNPSPWSSLSMHPVESFAYFSELFWYLLIPSNPIVGLFSTNMIGYGALNGHIGFDKLELTDAQALNSHAYTHYLHHKYFEVNYGGDGLVPLDKWLGTWHDGTKDADERMKARFKAKKDRLRAKANEKTGAGSPAE